MDKPDFVELMLKMSGGTALDFLFGFHKAWELYPEKMEEHGFPPLKEFAKEFWEMTFFVPGSKKFKETGREALLQLKSKDIHDFKGLAMCEHWQIVEGWEADERMGLGSDCYTGPSEEDFARLPKCCGYCLTCLSSEADSYQEPPESFFTGRRT